MAIHQPGWQHSAPHNSRFLQSAPYQVPFTCISVQPITRPDDLCLCTLCLHGNVHCPEKGQCRHLHRAEAVDAVPASGLQGYIEPVSCMHEQGRHMQYRTLKVSWEIASHALRVALLAGHHRFVTASAEGLMAVSDPPKWAHDLC